MVILPHFVPWNKVELVPLTWEYGGSEVLTWQGKSGETSNVLDKTCF